MNQINLIKIGGGGGGGSAAGAIFITTATPASEWIPKVGQENIIFSGDAPTPDGGSIPVLLPLVANNEEEMMYIFSGVYRNYRVQVTYNYGEEAEVKWDEITVTEIADVESLTPYIFNPLTSLPEELEAAVEVNKPIIWQNKQAIQAAGDTVTFAGIDEDEIIVYRFVFSPDAEEEIHWDLETDVKLSKSHLPNGIVRYDIPQTLTDAEKAQARSNIGVSSGGDVGTVHYDEPQALTSAEKLQARANIDAPSKDGYYQQMGVGYADKAGNLDSWESRDESSVENKSNVRVRTTAGDESINGNAGATLLSFICRGADYAPTRIISSGVNLLRLQSNNGLAVAIGTGWYFPVPKLTATNDSIGTTNENNGVLFVDSDGNNLTPTVHFKALADGVPTSLNDGVVATYLDKNGRRHYTTSGDGYLIVSGITHASTCARIAWSTDYDKFVSPTSELDDGTIASLTGIGTLRSVGLGGILVSDKAERISDTQMRKTVNVGISTNLTWTDIQEVDSEGEPTGNYTHTATITGMLLAGVADIKLSGASEFFALDVEGNAVSFVDPNETVASGYTVKYQLEVPTTSNVNVGSVFANISDWGIEYLEASGEGSILWQYAQGIPDSIYALLAKREVENGVIAQTFAYLKSEIDSLNERLKNYGDIIRMAVVDSVDYKTCGKPMFLECSTAGAPNASRIPDNWDEGEYGVWTGTPLAPHSFYFDIASKKVYFAPRCTNSTSDWIALN